MLVLPIKDVIPSRTIPFVTLGLIAAHIAAALIETAPPLRWIPLAGNMLFLWIFGENTEDRMGHGRFLFFYLACGVAAGASQAIAAPHAAGAAAIASGAAAGGISGVVGAYFVLFPQSRVLTLVWLIVYVELIEVPALVFLGFWVLLQLLSDAGSIGALWAHAIGFLVGMSLVLLLRRPERMKIEWIERSEPRT